jgi:hypothetical protein
MAPTFLVTFARALWASPVIITTPSIVQSFGSSRVNFREAGAIDENLATAHIILMLVSASFLASAYCFNIDMKWALERHERGEARVIPVILQPSDWE